MHTSTLTIKRFLPGSTCVAHKGARIIRNTVIMSDESRKEISRVFLPDGGILFGPKE